MRSLAELGQPVQPAETEMRRHRRAYGTCLSPLHNVRTGAEFQSSVSSGVHMYAVGFLCTGLKPDEDRGRNQSRHLLPRTGYPCFSTNRHATEGLNPLTITA